MKVRTIVIIVLVVAIGVFVAWRVLLAKPDHTPRVTAAAVEATHLTKEVIATGVISSSRESAIAAEASGRVASVLVDVGDHVAAGSVIVRLDEASIRLREQNAIYGVESARRSIREQLMSLRSQYADANDAVRTAAEALTRTQNLHEIGSATDDALRTASDSLASAQRALDAARERLNYREGRAPDDDRSEPSSADDEIVNEAIEVKQAEATLDGVRHELAGYTIRARIAGTVTKLPVSVGDMVSAGSPIAQIDDRGALEIVSPIDEVDLGYVAIGQPVRIESDSFIGTSLEGRVERIAPIIERVGDTRVCNVTIDFSDPDGIGRIGASCTVYVTVRDLPDAPAIPIEAYFIEAAQKYVYLLEPTTAGSTPAAEAEERFTLVKRPIETGIIGIERVEVTDGLELGDRVVASGVSMLHDGQVVAVRPTEDGGDQPH